MIICVQEQQQKKAARLLVLEKLHRDLAAKFEANRADVSRLQVGSRSHQIFLLFFAASILTPILDTRYLATQLVVSRPRNQAF